MQARRRAAAGTFSSSAGGKLAAMHQHAAAAFGSAPAAAIAQPLGPPQSGQRVASTPGLAAQVDTRWGAVMWVVF